MKEAIGNSFVLGLVITFLIIFMLFFATSLSYTKAFKVKNRIVEILEKYEDVLNKSASNNNKMNSIVETEINKTLSDIGYRISVTPNACPDRNGKQALMKNATANYEYCVYRYETSKGIYYGVTAYMYYEIPIIGAKLRFPVYGETKINGVLGSEG